MNELYQHAIYKKKTLNVNDLLLLILAFWPFMWNVWGALRITSSISGMFPMYCLWGITALFLIINTRFRKSFLFIWFIFLAVIVLEAFPHLHSILYDASVIFCGALICIILFERNIDDYLIIKCLVICGIIVSISVILDNTLGIFSDVLISIYTDSAQETKRILTASGGIIPHTGSAGCFIYAGMASYLALLRIKKKKIYRLNSVIIFITFGLAAILIQKRGFIIDLVVTVLFIKVLQVEQKALLSINYHKLIKRIFIICVCVVGLVLLYNRLPFVRDSVDSLIDKFTASDNTYSGRADLYALAFTLYKGNKLTGIGWGNYRLNTIGFFGREGESYAAHNVYIQLLCETGIIGLTAFLLVLISSLVFAIKKYRRILKREDMHYQRNIVELGIYIQVFFLAYCMSGNALYDYNFLMIYFIGILLTLLPIKIGER